jgi:hypothetical protein
MQPFTETPAHANRYDKVDVLTLIDPHWLENTQAAKLIRMVSECKAEEQRQETVRMDAMLAA